MLFLSKVNENTFCVKDHGLKVAKTWPWVLPHCAQQSVSLSDVMNNTRMWQKYWMCHEPIFFSFMAKVLNVSWANLFSVSLVSFGQISMAAPWEAQDGSEKVLLQYNSTLTEQQNTACRPTCTFALVPPLVLHKMMYCSECCVTTVLAVLRNIFWFATFFYHMLTK